MNFDLTEDQREIKRTAHDFLAARYTPEKIRKIALDGEPDPHWDEISELGWPDVMELGMVELAVVAEELGLLACAVAACAPPGRPSCSIRSWRVAARSRCGRRATPTPSTRSSRA